MAGIALEDGFEDVVGKAMRGMGMEAGTLSFLTGVGEDEIEKLLDGELDESALRKVAPILGLDGETLVERGRGKWCPAEVEMDGLRQFVTPHEDYAVNSYMIWDPYTMEAAMFDTGTNADEAYALIEALGVKVKTLFLTHTHVDHVKAIEQVRSWGEVVVRIGEREPIGGALKFAIGDEFSVGSLKVETRLTWGHSPGGTTFVVEGLKRPVAIVGDALFAQSMGGGVVSYQDALETNRKEIFSLVDETIICPGHGPMTSVGEEKLHNPFFPEFK
ncbi:MAG: MBL fold metallo-hydrolase [Verrucomicrobiota bacterium]